MVAELQVKNRSAIAAVPNDPALSVQGLDVRFGAQSVLSNVQMDLKDGCYACLLGESGSGKSTLLAAIAGLIKPRAGSIRLRGQNVFSIHK
ncbi:ATP-binding cassette domain-containing protein [Acidithiobacillus thiooxidans]|uniref:ATP-binding cassette domain-containing protein n=1 Tax=Acidithiobacillus thiooxidans TaxID=930 RepID=UPI002854AD62|nr:ATP-binding cassette domain-containing protein [Acidithiobacillus thiooxidans]MDR7928482.1 ATP-binding cassette domain-containing protein [Acidithiobacillus thiooxidans]